jgi:hypothetical protein
VAPMQLHEDGLPLPHKLRTAVCCQVGACCCCCCCCCCCWQWCCALNLAVRCCTLAPPAGAT